MMSMLTGVFTAILLYILYCAAWCAYCLWFHPLAKYPGPRLAAVSELWYAKLFIEGFWPYVLHDAHLKYGEVVRIAPNELSFSTIQSVKDIYGPPSKTRKLFTKSELFYDIPGPSNITYERDPETHARRLKLLTPGFRTQALRDQEHIIHEHVDLLLDQLGRLGGPSTKGVDMVKAYEWLTFDIIGQLVFGESFGAVKEGRSHYWVSILLNSLYSASLFAFRKRIPAIGVLIAVIPYISKSARELLESNKQHSALTLEKVRKRIEMGDTNTDDIFAHILKNGGMNEPEMASEAMVLITGGAETTAVVLIAAVWYLSTNPKTLERIQQEIRTSFRSFEDITGDSTATLPYMNAVIEECLRLFPPVPGGTPRKSPGETVDGRYIPAGSYVSSHLWYIHRDPDRVTRPDAFEPERWLGDRVKNEKPFTWPFLIGPRACLGINLAYLEMRITLAKLVYRYDWTLAHDLSTGFDWPSECRLQMMWKKPPLNVFVHPADRQSNKYGSANSS